jgi:hypothetical protein
VQKIAGGAPVSLRSGDAMLVLVLDRQLRIGRPAPSCFREREVSMAASEQSPRDALWRMANAYQVSQAIHVAASLGLADHLTEGPRTVEELADATGGSHAPSLYRLLRALASVGIFAEVDGRFGLTPLAEYLRSDAPGSVRAWAAMVGRPYAWSAWSSLRDSVATGEPAFPALHGMSAWEYRAEHPEEGAIFDAAMNSLATTAGGAVVDAYDFSGIGVLVDVGGGQGELLAGILAANLDMRGILFDQPHVVAGAGPVLERAGVADRCEVIGGSFFEQVPVRADGYLLKSVIHDWDDAPAIQILQRCRAAMADTDRLLLVEYLVRPGNEPDPLKFRDLMMLVMVGGRERTADDFRRLYAEAGFRLTDVVPAPPYSVIEGRPV